MINGRGYPDTINPNPLPTPTDLDNCGGSCNGGIESQVESSLVTATAGETDPAAAVQPQHHRLPTR